MRSLQLFLSDSEKQVLELRQIKRMTFEAISEELGYKHYQQSQMIYNRALEKLRAWDWMQKNDPALLAAARAYSWTPRQLLHLYHTLKKRGILSTYKEYTQEELLTIDGIGEVYADFLTAVKYAGQDIPRVVKVQVDEAF
jgi:hypothetical protein